MERTDFADRIKSGVEGIMGMAANGEMSKESLEVAIRSLMRYAKNEGYNEGQRDAFPWHIINEIDGDEIPLYGSKWLDEVAPEAVPEDISEDEMKEALGFYIDDYNDGSGEIGDEIYLMNIYDGEYIFRSGRRG